MAERIRVLLAEDHAIVAQGLVRLLEEDFEVLGVVSRGPDVPREVKRHKPDVLLLDLTLPGRNGLDLIHDILKAVPKTRILVITMHADAVLAGSAFAVGALGFIPKDCEYEELQTAITEVWAGRHYRSPLLRTQQSGPGPRSPARGGFWDLTPRRQQIIRAIRAGKTTEEMAAKLGLSVHTVHFHRRNLRRALGIATDDGLMRYALSLDIGEEE